MDDAIIRSGGFGPYQWLIYLLIANFKVFGDQLIFNFVYFIARHKMICLHPGATDYKTCTRDEVCHYKTIPGLIARPDTGNKNYIYGLTADYEDMNCWSDHKIAFMAQCWFIGFIVKWAFMPCLEKYGH
jgi:hypothetical protein